MSDFLLETGRQTLMLELQEASRLPERLGEDFVRAANTIIHCEGKVIVAGIGKSGHIGKKIAATLASTGTPASAPPRNSPHSPAMSNPPSFASASSGSFASGALH
mgnify:CR=1 FL=1